MMEQVDWKKIQTIGSKIQTHIQKYKFSGEKPMLHQIVGELIEISQELEMIARKVTTKLNIKIPDTYTLERLTLNKAVSLLRSSNNTTQEQCDILKHIVELRNWVNHQVFHDFYTEMKQHDNSNASFSSIETLNTKLNLVKTLLYEAMDFLREKLENTTISNVIR